MALFAGLLRTSEATPLTSISEDDATSVINAVLATYQAERNAAQGLFVAEQTTNHTERVQLGGFDEGQEIGPDGRPRETYTSGYVDAAYPLKRIGWALGWNLETFARFTVADLDRQVAAKTAGNAKRHMREIFRAFFDNVNGTFIDEDYGSLTIRRLANTDGSLFPATTGTDAEAQDNHYLVSGYLTGAMSATNNPLVTLAAEVREHFDATSTVVAFINSAQRANIVTLLPSFVDAPTEGIVAAPADAQALDIDVTVPGEFIGTDGDSGVRVYVYNRVPATYIVGGVVGAPAPLKRRIPAIASLQGFAMVDEERHFPFYKRTWIERFGYGTANRLSFAVMQLKASGTYDVPAST